MQHNCPWFRTGAAVGNVGSCVRSFISTGLSAVCGGAEDIWGGGDWEKDLGPGVKGR